MAIGYRTNWTVLSAKTWGQSSESHLVLTIVLLYLISLSQRTESRGGKRALECSHTRRGKYETSEYVAMERPDRVGAVAGVGGGTGRAGRYAAHGADQHVCSRHDVGREGGCAAPGGRGLGDRARLAGHPGQHELHRGALPGVYRVPGRLQPGAVPLGHLRYAG